MKPTDPQLDIDFLRDPQIRGNAILDDLNKVREYAPLFWSEKSQLWMASRHQDVAAGFMGEKPLMMGGRLLRFALLAVPEPEKQAQLPNICTYLPKWIVGLDAPDHTRVRKLIMKAFTKPAVEKVRDYARQRIVALLDQAADKGGVVEFNEEVARPVPGYVIFKLLGIPETFFPQLREWSNTVVSVSTTPGAPFEDLLKAEKALGAMNDMVKAELDKRARSPQDDLLTKLQQASEDGDRLSLDELLATMHILIIAGHDTTANSMTLGTEILSSRPEAWQYIRDNPDQILKVVNELMRYMGMAACQHRVATQDFQWHDTQIRKGDIVALMIAAANRDPRVFEHPDELDFTRNNTESQVFAPGIHHCIGHLLAKMQLTEFFSALVEHFDGVELLDQELSFLPGLLFRGVDHMNVRLIPRRP